ncbi:TIGR03086 family metal-binding protein [Kitasatospora sp. NPDC101176]|uniref:TIGR03086 family metal-binding protein n=1 Tax=Kitasatospora sp. NPDC101176 TaxID=3364099 RepID=UPI00382CFAC5
MKLVELHAQVELHARSLELAAEVVDTVRPDQLDLPTPCAGWPLRRLLAHVVGQHQGFAAAARGAGPDLALWADAPVGDDPAGAFRRTGAELTAAFRGAAAAGRAAVRLPEIRPDAAVPTDLAVGFHLLDTLVHGWDVAAAVGARAPLVAAVDADEALAAALSAVAEAVPAAPENRTPGKAFGPRLEPDARGGRFERALALLGRDPAWRP